MSYKYLEHTTDAFIEVKANNLEEALLIAGQSVVETMIDSKNVQERQERNLEIEGKDLRYLLYNWLEEIIILVITEGFAIRRFQIILQKENGFKIKAKVFGEEIDFKKHNFKMEIKSPTFHLMEIIEGEKTVMRFLLDL